MSGKQPIARAQALVEAVRTTREAFTRERLGDIETLGMQVMLVLYLKDGLSLKECAERLSVGATNVSKAVGALVSRGLAERGTQNFRTATLTLSSEGLAKVERFLDTLG